MQYGYIDDMAKYYVISCMDTPNVKTPIEVMRAVVFNPGIKEIAGIFTNTQGWGVIAECILGNGDRA